jgi:hypothetical protein
MDCRFDATPPQTRRLPSRSRHVGDPRFGSASSDDGQGWPLPEEEIMVALSGSFDGEIVSQTTTVVTDEPGHVLNLAQVAGPQTSTDEKWNGADIVYWGAADLVDGNGSQHGYFVNTHPNGDRTIGTFGGQVTTAGEQITLSGEWQFTGGTGEFEGIEGGGGYNGRFTSLTAIKMEWDGEYKI